MTSISLRMDEELKQQFDKVCNELGLSMTAAITIFAKATVRKQGIPFDVVIGTDSITPDTEAKLLEAESQALSISQRVSIDDVIAHARSAINHDE